MSRGYQPGLPAATRKRMGLLFSSRVLLRSSTVCLICLSHSYGSEMKLGQPSDWKASSSRNCVTAFLANLRQMRPSYRRARPSASQWGSREVRVVDVAHSLGRCERAADGSVILGARRLVFGPRLVARVVVRLREEQVDAIDGGEPGVPFEHEEVIPLRPSEAAPLVIRQRPIVEPDVGLREGLDTHMGEIEGAGAQPQQRPPARGVEQRVIQQPDGGQHRREADARAAVVDATEPPEVVAEATQGGGFGLAGEHIAVERR